MVFFRKDKKDKMVFCRVDKKTKQDIKKLADYYEMSESALFREIINRAIASYYKKRGINEGLEKV